MAKIENGFVTYSDGFVWKLLSPDQVREICQSSNFNVYVLDPEDETEWLLNKYHDIERVINAGELFALEVGFVCKPQK